MPTFYDSGIDGYGDLKGIENKLDYIKQLHMSGIHLSALYDSGTGLVDQGYQVINHTKIWSRLGNEDDFKSLVESAHKKGKRHYFVQKLTQ